MRFLKKITLIAYFTILFLLFFSLRTDLLVWTSFFVNAFLISIIFLYHVFIEKEYSPFLSAFIIFTFLFFLVAPVLQINGLNEYNSIFPNRFPFQPDKVIFTNILIFIFNLVFFSCYLFFKKVKILKTKKVTNSKVNPLVIFSVLILSILVFIGTFNYVIEDFKTSSWAPPNSIFVSMLLSKILFVIPFAGIILSYYYIIRQKKNKNYIIIFISFLIFIALFFWFKNPLTEKRNALGPLYITLIFLFFPKILNKNIKILSFLFFSMIIAFPFVSIFTHLNFSLGEIIRKPKILIDKLDLFDVFNTLHYDAFANICATLDYVSVNGFSLGEQLLSAYLFFIPRKIWNTKPISTGELVGDHLNNYGLFFSNLSNPFVSEGYINFGIFGVIFGAVLLAFVFKIMLVWLKSSNILKKYVSFYFSIHLIFFLRGDFTNGYVFFIGTLIGVLVIPTVINIVCLELLKFNLYLKKKYAIKR